jgi:hypothetical protein
MAVDRRGNDGALGVRHDCDSFGFRLSGLLMSTASESEGSKKDDGTH